MIGLFLSKFKWQIIGIVAVGLIAALAYGYWNYSQNKIAELVKQNAVLESAVETQNKTIKKLQDNFEKFQKNLNDLNKKYNDISKDTQEQKKDTKIISIDPKNKKQIQDKINIDINKIFSDINNISNL